MPMTCDELYMLRKSLKLTQAEFANRMGLKLRAYNEIERGRSPLRKIHELAIGRVALAAGSLCAPPDVLQDALALSLLDYMTEEV